MTTNHPAHGPVSLDRLHQIHETLSKAAVQSDGSNLGYAMADAVKVIDGVIATTNIEPVACIDRANLDYLADGFDGHVWATSYAEPGDVLLYTTPITPISPDKMTVEMAYPRVQTNWHDAKNFAEGWNACLAAMIQTGNHTEQHLDMVDHFDDANEKVDFRLPFDQWLSQQNEPIDVDCGCVTTEAFFHWLRVAYEDGNSPVAPGAWIPVSERMPDKLIPVMVMYEDGEMWSAMWNGNHWDDGTEYPDPRSVTHWRKMPAAPQQEVKLALEHGMQRYAGAMQKLSEGDK